MKSQRYFRTWKLTCLPTSQMKSSVTVHLSFAEPSIAEFSFEMNVR